MRHFIYIHLFLAFVLIGCSDFDSKSLEDESKQEIRINCAITQANLSRVNDTGFTSGDIIGIYVINSGETLGTRGNQSDNVKYVYDGGKWLSETPFLWSDQNAGIDVYGYYPFNKTINDVNNVSFNIEQRQDTETTADKLGGYESSDFLWAKTTNITPTHDVDLIYHHIMSSIQVTLVEGDGFNGEWGNFGKDVTIRNVVNQGTVDLSCGTVKINNDATRTSIIPYQKNSEWRCIIAPQNIEANRQFVKITFDDTEYSFSRQETTEFQSGKLYKISIRIDRAVKGDYKFSIIGESITAWENDAISHDAQARSYLCVNVGTPGALASTIANMGLNAEAIENLKLTGCLGDADFKFMRDNMIRLTAVNLKDITTEKLQCDNISDTNVIPDLAFSCIANKGRVPIKHIVFPDNLRRIGNNAFAGCALTQILDFPEGLVSIGIGAFYENGFSGNIISIQLPTTLKEIGNSAFSGCGARGEIVLPENITYLGFWAFSDNLFTGPLKIPECLTEIPWGIYSEAGGEGPLVIPNSIQSIGDMAFYNTQISSLFIEDGVKTIGIAAFKDCDIAGELCLPQSVVRIGEESFSNTNIKHVKFSPNLAAIPKNAFSGCTELTDTLKIGEGVRQISDNAFSGCSSISALVLPKGLEIIGANAFDGCLSVSYIECKGVTPPQLDNSAFNGVAKDNFTLIVPKGAVNAYRSAAGWREFKRISECKDFVCRPQLARLLNKKAKRNVILNSGEDWSVTHQPSWIHPSKISGSQKSEIEITIDEMPHGISMRCDSLVFTQKVSNETTCYRVEQYDYAYDEDSYIKLMSATSGNGVNLVFLGDGFDAVDISSGKYLEDINTTVEMFFGVEPYSSYKEYFNVYVPIALSNESGVGSLNFLRDTKFNTSSDRDGGRISCDFDNVLFYAIDNTPIKETEIDQMTCVVLANYISTKKCCSADGVTVMYSGSTYGEGASVAIFDSGKTPDAMRGVVQHEAGGHGFGKLADEYIYHNTFIDLCKCRCCKHLGDLIDMQELGFGRNLSISGYHKDVPWNILMEDTRYSDIVDIYEGGYFHSRGVYRSETNSCMNNNVPYFSTWCRYLIVQRIMHIAGEKFDYESFLAKDKRDWGNYYDFGSRADGGYSAPAFASPIISKTKPSRKNTK